MPSLEYDASPGKRGGGGGATGGLTSTGVDSKVAGGSRCFIGPCGVESRGGYVEFECFCR